MSASPTGNKEDIVERIRDAVEGLPEGDVLLSLVLVERALNHWKNDGTLGSRSDVKSLITALTHGMVDICTEPSSPLARG